MLPCDFAVTAHTIRYYVCCTKCSCCGYCCNSWLVLCRPQNNHSLLSSINHCAPLSFPIIGGINCGDACKRLKLLRRCVCCFSVAITKLLRLVNFVNTPAIEAENSKTPRLALIRTQSCKTTSINHNIVSLSHTDYVPYRSCWCWSIPSSNKALLKVSLN